MNRSFKIVAYHPYLNQQMKKRVCTTEKDFLKYKDDLINRYKKFSNVKCFELINEKWIIIKEILYDHSYDYRYKSFLKT